jgi:glycine oxidase
MAGINHRSDLPVVAIVGAGVIGLGIAWRLAQGNARVTVFDKAQAGSGASFAAAGMLGICAEAEPGEEALVALGRLSQSLWPNFAAELEEVSGQTIGLQTQGTLLVALTADDQARICHHLAFQHSLKLPVGWISAREVREREPHLAAGIAGAVFSPEDHQVDNRKLASALALAARRSGATIKEYCPVRRILQAFDRVVGVELEDGSQLRTDLVVLAAGAWSRGIEGLPAALRPPVRPVKGQMLALQMDPAAPLLRHVVRALNGYLVPRLDGRLIVGATVEEKGFDTRLTAGGMLALLDAAWRVVPAIEELAIVETWTGHRPGSRDDAPILGSAPLQGLLYATGHHRNGILLAPVTAKMVAQLALQNTLDPAIAPFGFDRFSPAHAAE